VNDTTGGALARRLVRLVARPPVDLRFDDVGTREAAVRETIAASGGLVARRIIGGMTRLVLVRIAFARPSIWIHIHLTAGVVV
jgi:hypothetical protein